MCDMATISQERHTALDLLNRGAYKEAEPLLRVVVERLQGQRDAELFTWQRRVAESLTKQGKFAEAEPMAQAALKGFESKYGKIDEDALDCRYILAESLNGQRKYITALPHAQTAMKGLEENMKRGPEHHTTLACKVLCAVILQAQRQYAEAKILANEALQNLEAFETKAEILESQGSRRLSNVELLGMRHVKTVLATEFNIEGELKDANRHSSKETVSTYAPSADSETNSRFPSKA